MRKLTGLLLGIVLVVGIAGLASAAESASITLKVTCAPEISITISTDTYNFGSVAPNTATISTQTITVTNTSGSLTEDYTIMSDTYTAVWNLQMSDPGASDDDVFSLMVWFKDTQPGDSDFLVFMDTDTATQQNMDTNFGSAGYNGDDVLPTAGNEVRNIWFRLHTPGITSTQEEQSLSVTITANPGTLF